MLIARPEFLYRDEVLCSFLRANPSSEELAALFLLSRLSSSLEVLSSSLIPRPLFSLSLLHKVSRLSCVRELHLDPLQNVVDAQNIAVRLIRKFSD